MHEMVKETLLQLRKSIIAALVASTAMHKMRQETSLHFMSLCKASFGRINSES